MLKSGTWLEDLCPVKVVKGSEELGSAPMTGNIRSKEIKQTLMGKLSKDLTGSQLRQVSELLDKYGDVFSENKFDMGRTHLVEHSIDTGANRPIRQGFRRHPRAHLEVIDEQVSELVMNDFVESAASPGRQVWCWLRKGTDRTDFA